MTSSEAVENWKKHLSMMDLDELKTQVIIDILFTTPSSVLAVVEQDKKLSKMTVDELSARILLGE